MLYHGYRHFLSFTIMGVLLSGCSSVITQPVASHHLVSESASITGERVAQHYWPVFDNPLSSDIDVDGSFILLQSHYQAASGRQCRMFLVVDVGQQIQQERVACKTAQGSWYVTQAIFVDSLNSEQVLPKGLFEAEQ